MAVMVETGTESSLDTLFEKITRRQKIYHNSLREAENARHPDGLNAQEHSRETAVRDIMAVFDLTQISAYEIDDLVKALWESGFEGEDALLALSNWGALCLQHHSGQSYSETQLHQKKNLLAPELWQLDLVSNDPYGFQAFTHQIAFLKGLQEFVPEKRA